MGLTTASLVWLKPYLKSKSKVLTLGHQDIVAPQEFVEKEFGYRVSKLADNGTWHGVKYALPDTSEFWAALGIECTAVDIVRSRGTEIVCDLNYPCLPEFEQGFDVVIDGGTLEHCFNIAQGLQNATSWVKRGGVMFHVNPMTMMNHGFYCLMPTWYHDFYTQNGWEILDCVALDIRSNEIQQMPRTTRFSAAPELSTMILARRLDNSGFSYPTQTKYLKNPGLH